MECSDILSIFPNMDSYYDFIAACEHINSSY